MNSPDKILSIVVPTYNMEEYLCDCLDSVTRADVPSSLDLILVNDGSTDSSFDIMQKYQKKRPDIITIIDKSNGHYGSCINAGLNIAKGKYFRPLDADDWFNTDALIKLINKLEHSEADLIITPRTEITDKKRVLSLDIEENRLYEVNSLRKKEFSNVEGILSMHSMTYKLSLLKNIPLVLTEGICYTDTEYCLIPLQYTKNFIFFNLELYQYRLGRVGQSIEGEQYEKNRHHLAKVLNSILGKIHFSSNSIEYKRVLSLATLYYSMVLFNIISNNIDKKDIQLLNSALIKEQPNLWKEINKTLYFFPFISNITGTNFNFYCRLKKTFARKHYLIRSPQNDA